jgi:hypothetical protein
LFRKDGIMRTPWLTIFTGVALVFFPILVMAVDDAAQPLAIELKSFSFKVPEGKADLFGYNAEEEKLYFYTNGLAEVTIMVPKDGDHEVVVKASEDRALTEGAKFKVAIDGKQLGKETETSGGEPKEYRFPVSLKVGEHKLSIEFTNDVFKDGEYDRNLYVHGVTLKRVK